ncbi:putative carbonic anhydrase 5 [Condylostylus longicornis]|uniref:putative carbonic anhydrase 5 n=1 Tax=Condylostylus longicornis TaxID=2530218 RepID=UPI00244E5514|nr:putative carbonic anhydrase 5 [Condylostylus longicornis]
MSGAVFVNLKKAFDVVNHPRHCDLIKNMGIRALDLQNVDKVKYLRMIIDENLRWDYQIKILKQTLIPIKCSSDARENCTASIYGETRDQDVWPVQCVTGNYQSPIDIPPKVRSTSAVITYHKFDQKLEEVTLVHQDYLRKQLPIQQFDLHWGSSEHSVGGKFYDGEIHLYGKDSNKRVHVILTAFLKKADNVNNTLTRVIKLADEIKQPDQRVTGHFPEAEDFYSFLEVEDKEAYFYYEEGSRTYPDCRPNIAYIIYNGYIEVESQAMENLKNLKDSKGRLLTCTYRSIQPLNGRTVRKKYPGH